MNDSVLMIEIEGEAADDLYPDLLRLEVESDDELATFFKFELAIAQQNEGLWSYLDDDRLQLWKALKISVGFDEATEPLVSGYITHLKPVFSADVNQCVLEVWGMDGSVLMDREEKLKDWPNKKDSDIANEIFAAYGLSVEVDDTAIIHDEAISTIIQRETDIQFLKRLAMRNGLQCFVEGETGHFRAPHLDAEPQPVLSVHFGEETTLRYFALELNALSPVNVGMVQVDRSNKEVLETQVESSLRPLMGSTRGTDFLGPGMSAGQAYIGMNATTGSAEMSSLCQGLFHEGEWFVTGEGEIDANVYAHVLKPRALVTIKGMGESHSGVYYVSHVRHILNSDGYAQSFKVKRNAINPTGAENFTSDAGVLGALL